MIVIPEKVVFIKVPKAASTTIARMFWDAHGVQQFGTLSPNVATNIQHFVPLVRVGAKIPVLNGNWFYNRSRAFGWHTSFRELMHLFGDQLVDYHWVASVRHPVARLFSAFSFQIAKQRIAASLCTEDFEKFCKMVFSDSPLLTQQQRIHTWPQSAWLPVEDENRNFSIIHQESLVADVQRLAVRIPSFAAAQLGHDGRSFDGKWRDYVSTELQHRIETYYSEDMQRLGYRPLVAQESGVAK